MWKSLPNAVLVLIVSTLAVSVIYEWSYLHSVGLSFLEAPASLSDHARSALAWLPVASVGLVAMLLIELAYRRIDRTAAPSKINFFRELPFVAGEVFGGAGVIAYLLWGAVAFETFLLATIALWLTLWRWPLIKKWMNDLGSPAVQLTVIVIPIVAVYFMYSGIAAAKNDMNDANTTGLRTVALKTSNKPIEAKILRSYERATLLWLPGEKRLQIVATGDMQSIRAGARETTFTGLTGEKKPAADVKPQEKPKA